MFYSISQCRNRDQSIQDEHDAELEAAREADSFSFGLRHKFTNTRLEIEMNCNCISEFENKLADHYKGDAGNDARAVCQGVGFVFGKTKVEASLRIPFRITGSKKGFTSAKGKEVSFFVSYCPFCGKSTKPEAAPNLVSADSVSLAT